MKTMPSLLFTSWYWGRSCSSLFWKRLPEVQRREMEEEERREGGTPPSSSVFSSTLSTWRSELEREKKVVSYNKAYLLGLFYEFKA